MVNGTKRGNRNPEQTNYTTSRQKEKAYRNIQTQNSMTYSASTCKVIIDTGSIFKTSFGRISGYTGNRALRGFRRTAWPTALRRGRWPPAVAPPLQSLARFDAPLRGECVHNSPQIAPNGDTGYVLPVLSAARACGVSAHDWTHLT
jgi:hypothetical protein